MRVKYLVYMMLLAPMMAIPMACERDEAGGASVSDEKRADSKPASTRPAGPVADNSRCHVCHINYEEEELAVMHAQADVGCEKCHGASDDHCGDEGNITPPGIMYPKAAINASCMKCHYQIANDEEHKPVLAGTAKEEHCTDCHGEHRLPRRTQRWNKKTGEPIAGKSQ